MAARITPEAVEKAPSRFPNLETVLAMRTWPTPTVNETIGVFRQVTMRGDSPRIISNNGIEGQARIGDVIGGRPNPNWIEWLMGWPMMWTALEPLAMDRFREWLQQHGGC
jgi:hypothetical protein